MAAVLLVSSKDRSCRAVLPASQAVGCLLLPSSLWCPSEPCTVWVSMFSLQALHLPRPGQATRV